MRTFRLKKETVALNAGAIVEKGHDGNYYNSGQWDKFPGKFSAGIPAVAVETQPDWFEEIFDNPIDALKAELRSYAKGLHNRAYTGIPLELESILAKY